MSVGRVDAWLSKNKRGRSVVTVPFLNASLLSQLFSDMVRKVECHTGDPDLNPVIPPKISLGNALPPKTPTYAYTVHVHMHLYRES